MIKQAILIALLLLVFVVQIPFAVHASVTTTITPSNADTTTKSDNPDTNYGGDTFIEPLHGYTVTVHWYGFVMFDLSSIPSGAIITSANLKLFDTEGNSYYGGPSAFPVCRVDESWNESTLTWNTNPTIESTPTDSLTFGPSDTGYHSWNVTTDVQSFVSGNATNYGWCVQISADACWATFASKEGGGDVLPKLEITYELPCLVVRGGDNHIYYRSYNSATASWYGWNSLPTGTTLDGPAAVCADKLYFVVRGSDGNSLWFSSLNLTTRSFSGWTWLSGSTPSIPILTSNGTALALVVRGGDNRIYYRFYAIASQTWTGWSALPSGTTLDTPAASLAGDTLYIVVRGSDGTSLWHSYINQTTGSFSSWALLSGSTPSIPTLTSNGTALTLVVRGGDNRIYYRTYTISTLTWNSWTALTSGTTLDSPAATIIGNALFIVVRGSDGTSLWYSNMNLATSSFSGWTWLSGSTPSKPTLTS